MADDLSPSHIGKTTSEEARGRRIRRAASAQIHAETVRPRGRQGGGLAPDRRNAAARGVPCPRSNARRAHPDAVATGPFRVVRSPGGKPARDQRPAPPDRPCTVQRNEPEPAAAGSPRQGVIIAAKLLGRQKLVEALRESDFIDQPIGAGCLRDIIHAVDVKD